MRTSAAERAHGANILAPEERFAPGESPAPGAVEERPDTAATTLGGRLWGGLRVALGVAAVVGTSLLVAGSAHRYALTSPRFAVREVVLKGTSRFSVDEVKDLAGIHEGSNIFSLEPRALESRLLQNPWISSARVVRKLPNALEVELQQREARAVASVGDHLYLVSRDGEPFKELEPKDPVDLPVVTGLRAENLQRDRVRELERLRLALDVLSQYERLAMSRVYAAEEVHVADAGNVTLTAGKEGIVLALGSSGFRQRLLMAERVVQSSRQSGRLPGIVFADNQAHPERVVVRMR